MADIKNVSEIQADMTYNELWKSLSDIYDDAEAKAIVCYALDKLFGMSKADVYCGRLDELTQKENEQLRNVMENLAKAVPVQYAVGYADFYGRTFKVAPGVLIPRPETEELCQWVISNNHSGSILDVGTGSGCISITLSLELSNVNVSTWDISEEAIAIASDNARRLGANVNFMRQDALNAPQDKELWDVIVSNPPYICDKESKAMEPNVLEYEPHIALFVPDDNPLLFYSAIARYAHHALKANGSLYFEINPLYCKDMKDMLHNLGFSEISSRYDQFGKERFICCRKS